MSKLREIEGTMLRHDDPVVSVPELAEQIGRSTTHVRDQLRLLEREGVVASKDVGARATAWWHSERVSSPRALGDDEPRRQSSMARRDAQRDQGAPDDPRGDKSGVEMHAEMKHAAFEDIGAINDVAETWAEDRRAERRAAAKAAVWHVRENDGATGQELRENVEPEYPVEGQNARTWYRKTVRPVLRELGEFSESTQEWTVDE